jgi:hypothetical protein
MLPFLLCYCEGFRIYDGMSIMNRVGSGVFVAGLRRTRPVSGTVISEGLVGEMNARS